MVSYDDFDDDGFGRHGGDGDLQRVTYGQGPLESLAERDYTNPDRVIQTVEELAADGMGYDTDAMGEVIDAFVGDDGCLERAGDLWDALNNGAGEYAGEDTNPYEVTRMYLDTLVAW